MYINTTTTTTTTVKRPYHQQQGPNYTTGTVHVQAVKQYEPKAYAEFFPPPSSKFVEVLKSDYLLRITVTLSNGKVVMF